MISTIEEACQPAPSPSSTSLPSTVTNVSSLVVSAEPVKKISSSTKKTRELAKASKNTTKKARGPSSVADPKKIKTELTASTKGVSPRQTFANRNMVPPAPQNLSRNLSLSSVLREPSVTYPYPYANASSSVAGASVSRGQDSPRRQALKRSRPNDDAENDKVWLF